VFVGVSVGVLVGVSVGVFVGVAVGVSVGVCVGVFVGVAVGVSVGVSVGVFVGVSVGGGGGGAACVCPSALTTEFVLQPIGFDPFVSIPNPPAPTVKPVFAKEPSYTKTIIAPAGREKPSDGALEQMFVLVVGWLSHTPSLFASRLKPKFVSKALVQPVATPEATHARGTASAVVSGTSKAVASGPVQSPGLRHT
jgi:hypothetical protein